MNVSIIAVLLILELTLILLLACAFLIWRIYNQPVLKQLEHIDNSTSWLDHIKQKSNDTLRRQGDETLDLSKTDDADSSDSDTSNETISSEAITNEERALLQFRLQYLEVEKTAGETSNRDDPKFWETLLENLKSIATIASVEDNKEPAESSAPVNTIPDEIKHLREVIANQNEIINKLKETLTSTAKEEPAFDEILNQIEQLENFQKDAENCISSLESENERLAKALLQPDILNTPPPTGNGESMSDIMQVSVDEQDEMIKELEQTIDELKLEAEAAARLKETISNFTNQSKEMMSCIHTLEDENNQLKKKVKEHSENASDDPPPDNDTIEQLNEKIAELEQQLIKKDVDYVKLKESQQKEK